MNERILAVCQETLLLHEQFCQRRQEELMALAGRMAALFADEGQLLLAGHGPFFAIAQLLAAQLTFRLDFDRPVLPALCLGSDPLLTAQMVAAGQFPQHLVRHYRAVNSQEHLLLLFSDGSEAPELSALIEEAQDNEQPVFLFTANAQDPLTEGDLDGCIELGTDSVPRMLELAQFGCHLLCELIEKELFGR